MLDHQPPTNRLGPYALRAGDETGRQHDEPAHPFRDAFEVDRHRILSSTAFRRLERKTQVFAPSYHDHFRTRLTHTLETAHVARTLAVQLGANERLAEAISLAHDLGHPPFGHAGEEALDELMASHGGFNHNTHSVRVVEVLEHPFPAFRGLNLTNATRAGLAAHETRYDKPATHGADEVGRPNETLDRGNVEARIASCADRVAYSFHDLEDAIGAGFLDLSDLAKVSLWQEHFERVSGRCRVDHIHAIRRVVIDAMLDAVLADVIRTSTDRLRGIDSPEAARRSPDALLRPSTAMDARLLELEGFLRERVYRRASIAAADDRGRRIIRELFGAYRARPDTLPPRIRGRCDEQGLERVVCDYIAGMTDRFCVAAHRRVACP